jgi:protein-disulfide isomerase
MYPRRNNTLAYAIILAGLMVGGAILYTRGDASKTQDKLIEAPQTTQAALNAVRNVQPDDHIWGSPNAPIILITYSDFGCPFCKEYHTTMHTIVDLYGRDGKLAWVFRHIPIVKLHEEAPMYALASECVAKEAGNQAFWTFSDSLFDAIDIDVKPDTNKLLELAEAAGVSRQGFTSCMRANELMVEVEKDFDEAVAAGATASPFTVLLTPDGRTSFVGGRDFKPLSIAVQAALQTLGEDTLVSPSEAPNAAVFDIEATEETDGTSTEESLVPTGL